MSVVFLDDQQICRLHGDFMDDPTPTDVITFPGDPAMAFAGEICVSVDHAFSFAQRKQIDFSRELSLYLVHGYLHLAGHDDLNPPAKRKMRQAEKKALSLLENSGKLPTFVLSDHPA
jgi:probable rRNA maturation factor